MALVSVIRQTANGFSFQKETLLLAIGSIAGGVLGKEVLSAFVDYTPSDTIATSIQSYLLAGLLTIVVLRNRLPRMQIENRGVITVAGCVLGMTASFLGIGGGPINVSVLVLLLGMNVKEAAVNSLFVILLSQFSKVMWCMFDEGFAQYELGMLNVMIPGAFLGGLLGVQLNKNILGSQITKVFNLTLTALVILSIYNGSTELSEYLSTSN